MRDHNLFQRFVSGGFELLIAGLLAVLVTNFYDTGRGYDPNPIFWRSFIIIHMTFLLLIPLFAKGRTLGMLVMNFTVTSNNGKKPNLLQIVSRAVLGFGPVILTSGMWYFVSFFTGLVDPKGRGWGEIISYTTVKRKDQP